MRELTDPHFVVRESLTDLERQLPAIFGTIADGVTVLDRAGNVVFANAAAARIMGMAGPEEIVGQPSANVMGAFDLLDEQGRPLDVATLPTRRAFAGESAPEAVLRFRSKGSLRDRWSMVRARLLPGAKAEQDLVVTSFQDITAIKQVELRLSFLSQASAALGESLDYHETLARIANLTVPALADWCAVDVVEDTDQVHRVALAHADAKTMALVEEIQRRWPPDPANPGATRQVIDTGKNLHIAEVSDEMLQEAARDDQHLAMIRKLDLREVLVVPLIGRGKVLGALSVANGAAADPFTSDEITLVEELGRRAGSAIDTAKLMSEANEALRQRDEFLAIASHDMRTPLAAVRGYAQLALRHIDQEPTDVRPLTRWLTDIDESAGRLTGLVSELMDVSLLRGGRKVPLQLEPTDLVSLVNERVREHATSADERHAFKVTADVSELIGNWDASRLARVLDNLLGNAIKYSPDGGSIDVAITADGGFGSVAVTDHGIGIAAKDMARIFTPMFRGTNTGSVAGTGLGLSGSRTLVELMGGRIQVQSRLGHGSTFTIWLPIENAPQAAEDAH
ncbi:MAG TPA: PAS domain-containing sensor histidine kinase [Candidatus Limnocylindria bacterium]